MYSEPVFWTLPSEPYVFTYTNEKKRYLQTKYKLYHQLSKAGINKSVAFFIVNV